MLCPQRALWLVLALQPAIPGAVAPSKLAAAALRGRRSPARQPNGRLIDVPIKVTAESLRFALRKQNKAAKDAADILSGLDEEDRAECVRAADKDGNTALHVAASQGKPELVKLILEAVPGNFARTQLAAMKNTGGWTALHKAAYNAGWYGKTDWCPGGAHEVVKVLLDEFKDGKIDASEFRKILNTQVVAGKFYDWIEDVPFRTQHSQTNKATANQAHELLKAAREKYGK
uniref:Uncharacterized protein n=1 Tax=Zooxanthella nutricula TaxID=1333877 RepID=A0A6U6RDM2_9DINO